jgi:CheY-like chemotaxis protein
VVNADRVVLVVEDDESIRNVIIDVLHDHGFGVVSAANGVEALERLEARRPDVMVLDLLMPVMHGWDFMEAYGRRTGGTVIPIVVVSVNPALPRSFTRFGVRSVIGKPFQVDDLLEHVERAMAPAA